MSAAVTTDSYSTTTSAANGGMIHRILLDSSRRIYMGYDAVVQRLQEPDTYQVTFRQLTMSPAKAKEYLGDDPSSWTLVATPGWDLAAPRKVYAGEILVLPRGSSLSFVIGPDTFVLNTGARIAPGEGPFSLYVLYEPGWKPTHRNADLTAFITGATDSIETVLNR